MCNESTQLFAFSLQTSKVLNSLFIPLHSLYQ